MISGFDYCTPFYEEVEHDGEVTVRNVPMAEWRQRGLYRLGFEDRWHHETDLRSRYRAGLRWPLFYVEPIRVSSVFLGCATRPPSMYSHPLVYETMVFGGPFNHTCVRSASRAEALVVHARFVREAHIARSPWGLRWLVRLWWYARGN